MLRYIKLYWHFFKLRVQIMMEYRLDFIIGILSVLFIQGAGLFFVNIVFKQIQTIRGWSFDEVVFIYAVACCGRAIHHIFFDSLWVFGRDYIRNGGFDRMLVRPAPAFFQLIAERVQQDGVGQLLIGIWLLSYAAPTIGVEWTFVSMTVLIILILSSSMVFIGIHVFTCSLSFWMTDSMPVQWSVHEMSDFARYPLVIYNRVIQSLMTWIIPYGFTAFYPAAYFLRPETYLKMGWITPIIGFGCCLIGAYVWRKGVRNFTGTGS